MNRTEVDRQREHQANERTVLAWLRTSITLIGFGFALTQFGLLLRQRHGGVNRQILVNSLVSSENLGLGLVIFSTFMIALAAWRYNQVFWQIERGNYQPSQLIVWLMAGVVMLLGLLSIPLVFHQPG